MIRTRRPFVAFCVLVFSILSLRPAYPAQRAIVPDHVPPGLMKDIYLIATPRLARIPDLHGLWDPSFPLAYKTVWQDSGETIMCYGETRAQWPFEYPQYTAKGRPPDQQWHQEKMLKGYYRRGQINVTVRNSQWSSSWANDWQSRAEHHNRTYANETTTIRSMGPAPEIRTEVLPGPRTTHEFKRKSYFGDRFEAEFVVYRDTYRLEEYAAAGVAGGQHWRLQRVVSKDHVNHIRAQVRDTESPLEILINATSGDGKPVHESLVDEIISILLEAALEASGTPIPREEAAVEERVPIAEEEPAQPAAQTIQPDVVGPQQVQSDGPETNGRRAGDMERDRPNTPAAERIDAMDEILGDVEDELSGRLLAIRLLSDQIRKLQVEIKHWQAAKKEYNQEATKDKASERLRKLVDDLKQLV